MAMKDWPVETQSAYYRATGEGITYFSLPYTEENIKKVEIAIKTGKAIKLKPLPSDYIP